MRRAQPVATEPAGRLAEVQPTLGPRAAYAASAAVDRKRRGVGHRHDGIELIAIDYDIVVDRLPRPATLAADRNAYALDMVGEFMWPRFRRGRRLAVSPFEQVGIGDDVLVRLCRRSRLR